MTSALPARSAKPLLSIRPPARWPRLSLRELWLYRDLLYTFAQRDVKVRYKQTALGAAWAILQPAMTMVVFTIFFGNLAGVGSDGLPYPLFSYAGLLPWTFFAQGVSQASDSLVGSANLVRKVYFPRLVIPAASVVGGLVDFAIAFVVLGVLMAWYGVAPGSTVVFVPVFLLLAFVTALGVGTWLSALNVQFRDVKYVLPFFIQLWLFVTPVIYPASRVAAKLKQMGVPVWIYGLNPMAGVVEGFRWSLLGSGTRPGPVVLVSAAMSLLLLVSGAFYFRRMERTFADVV
jgi:lipopolysaccharide transport system permease protein